MKNYFPVIQKNPLGLFAFSWASLLLVLFLKIYPVPSTVTGFGWLLEICLATLLLITLTGLVWRGKKLFDDISAREFYLIILPCAGFITWSFASFFWAEATRSALHHSLLWTGYLLSYLVFRRIVRTPELFKLSIYSVVAVCGFISLLCIVEYILSNTDALYGSGFWSRYGKCAEAINCFLPVFLALFVFNSKKLNWFWLGLTFICYVAVGLMFSRAALIVGTVAILGFAGLYLWKSTEKSRRLVMITAVPLLLIAAFAIQIFLGIGKNSTLARLTNETKTESTAVRPFFASIAFEMWQQNPWQGVGADNFGLKFNEYRARFAAENPESSYLNIGEGIMLERTHNEYLQVFAELGIIGGFFFLWFLGGVCWLSFSTLKNRKFSPLTLGVMVGIGAFLASSGVSSFSFRYVPNGLIFFFLMAILARYAAKSKKVELLEPKNIFSTLPILRFSVVTCSVALICGLFVVSFLRGLSYSYIVRAERTESLAEAEKIYETARLIDAEQGSSDMSQGLRLYQQKRPTEAVPFLQTAINKGINVSACYSWLASAQTAAGDTESAEKTLAKAVRIFPNSVFIQTKYAAFLEKHGKLDDAKKHFEIALQLNKRDATIWRVAITEGFEQAGRIGKRDFDGFAVMDLNPPPAIYAVNDEQTIYGEKIASMQIAEK